MRPRSLTFLSALIRSADLRNLPYGITVDAILVLWTKAASLLMPRRGDGKSAVMVADGKMMTANDGNSAAIIDGESGQTAKCRHGGFRIVDVTALCRHTVLPFPPNGVPAPFQRRCFARSPVSGRSLRSISFRRSFSCQGQKRSRYIDTPTQTGAFPPLGFLYGCGYVTGPYCSISIAYFVILIG